MIVRARLDTITLDYDVIKNTASLTVVASYMANRQITYSSDGHMQDNHPSTSPPMRAANLPTSKWNIQWSKISGKRLAVNDIQ